MHGVSMRYTFTAPGAPSARRTQLYEMPGAHAIYRDGWKAVAGRRVTTGGGHDVAGAWEVYHVSADRAETRDVAARCPDQTAELAALWKTTAGRDTARPGQPGGPRSAARRTGSGLARGPGRLAVIPGRVPVPDAARRPAASGGRPGRAGG